MVGDGQHPDVVVESDVDDGIWEPIDSQLADLGVGGCTDNRMADARPVAEPSERGTHGSSKGVAQAVDLFLIAAGCLEQLNERLGREADLAAQ